VEIFFWFVGIVWIMGWVKELAYCSAKRKRHGIEYPCHAVRYAIPVVLFFTWPYFYFYGKAL